MYVEEFTWWDFFFAAIILLGIYFLLRFANKRLSSVSLEKPYIEVLKKVVYYSLVIYEPLVVLSLGSIFILIHPLQHGIIVAGLLIISFSHLRHYLSGRLLQLDKYLAVGKQIQLDHKKGVISDIKRTGLYVQTAEGRHFLNYTDLYEKGYTLVTNDDIGGFYQLRIKTPENQSGVEHLLDLLSTIPYLDWEYQPKIRPFESDDNDLKVQVSVKEERHLNEMMEALEEWGYHCSILS